MHKNFDIFSDGKDQEKGDMGCMGGDSWSSFSVIPDIDDIDIMSRCSCMLEWTL